MKQILYIFLGGGIGSVVRFLMSSFTQKLWTVNAFPMGTFMVNILGCFIIGVLSSIFLKTDSYLKFLLITGFCGGFTTFSTFSSESFNLWQNADYSTLFLYIILSVVIGILAVFTGYQVVKN